MAQTFDQNANQYPLDKPVDPPAYSSQVSQSQVPENPQIPQAGPSGSGPPSQPSNANLGQAPSFAPYFDESNKAWVLPPQTLQIYLGSMTYRKHVVTLEDKATPLYSCQAHSWSSAFSRSNPDLELHRGDFDTPIVATCKLHNLSPTELNMVESGTTSDLTRDSLMKIRYATTNPTNGQTYLWKSTRADTSIFSSGNLKLDSPEDETIARFTSSEHKSLSKSGKLEIHVPLRLASLDWVVLGCLALHEIEQRRRRSS